MQLLSSAPNVPRLLIEKPELSAHDPTNLAAGLQNKLPP
jgi:hypothetical protein